MAPPRARKTQVSMDAMKRRMGLPVPPPEPSWAGAPAPKLAVPRQRGVLFRSHGTESMARWAAEARAAAEGQVLLSAMTGHAPRRSARARLSPVPPPRSTPRWTEDDLLGSWQAEQPLRYYGAGPGCAAPLEGMRVLKAGNALQPGAPAPNRYLVLQTSPGGGARLDTFPAGPKKRKARQLWQLPLSHAQLQRDGRRLTVTVHPAVHSDCTSAGAPIVFEWEDLREAQGWAEQIARAGVESESAESRAVAARHEAAQAAEQERAREKAEQGAAAEDRLEHEVSELKQRQQTELAAVMQARNEKRRIKDDEHQKALEAKREAEEAVVRRRAAETHEAIASLRKEIYS